MEEQRNDELSLLAWMNVVLSFLFMVVAVPLLVLVKGAGATQQHGPCLSLRSSTRV